MGFRKFIIRVKIKWLKLKKYIIMLYHRGMFYLKISQFFQVLIAITVFLLLLGYIALLILQAWNAHIYPLTGIRAPSFSIKDLFTGRFNIFWIIGVTAGTIMTAFRRTKLDWFAEQVKVKPGVIYIFGSNQLVEKIVKELIALGYGPMVGLIADKKYYWIEDLSGKINALILDSAEELNMATLYDKIGFQNAIKVLCLVDEPEKAQYIITHVRRVNPKAEIVLLSRNKPFILDIIGGTLKGITIVEDLDALAREILRAVALGFRHAPVIEAEAPQDYIGKSVEELEADFDGKIKVLAIKRGNEIVHDKSIKEGDILILYLVDQEVLKEFIELIPQIQSSSSSAESKETIAA